MERPINQLDVIPQLMQLEDSAFLELLGQRKVVLRVVNGELRVSAPAGVVHQDLLDELKRRKSRLILLLEGKIQRRVPFAEIRESGRAKSALSPNAASIRSRAQQLGYWESQLSGASTLLELPFSKTRRPTSSPDIDVVSFPFPAEALGALQSFASSEGYSLNTVLLAVFTVLLFRATERKDFCVSARLSVKRAETSDRWNNIAIIRCQMEPEPSFREWVRTVSVLVSEASENGSVPYEILPKHLELESEPGVAPIAQILFDFDLAEVAASGLDGGRTGAPTRQRESNGSVPVPDLTFSAGTDANASLAGSFAFRRDVYDVDDMQGLADTFCTLLTSCALNEASPIGELALLSAIQQQQMLVEWNRTEIPLEASLNIHRMFERQAAANPNAIAIVHGTEQMSYRELNERANQLAHLLLKHGVRLEEPVGICITRSVAMVVAMLGVLKAGGCYLPLEPTHPPDRLNSVLSESKARIVISETTVLHSIALQAEQLLALDAMSVELSAQPNSNPELMMSASNLAYLIYTSGSTGRPKGVAIEHHSTVSFLHWAKQHFSSMELSRVLASTSICFDLSVFEIFVPLSWGSTAVLVNDLLDFSQNQEALAVTLVNTVPSVMSAVLASSNLIKTILCVNLAGEPLSSSLVQRIEQDLPEARIHDLYGPTETTTYSTMALRRGGETPTIGRPIANTKIFILDSRMQPVPPNIPGQMLIGGEGVARGYLYQPEMTAEKFITLLHLPEAGRLYQTGDLAVYKADGRIEYRGRIDRQIKLRGFRVELAEIEAVLRKNDQVLETVVVVSGDTPENKRLIAYVVPRRDHPGAAELVAFQRAFLPSYMVVTEIVFLEKIPLTSNGKVDLKALSSTEILQEEETDSSTTEMTQTEAVLIAIWEKYFKRAPIHLNDDFFALGGNSLLAYQIFAEIEKKFQAQLFLSVLFKAPTVRLLATMIDQAIAK